MIYRFDVRTEKMAALEKFLKYLPKGWEIEECYDWERPMDNKLLSVARLRIKKSEKDPHYSIVLYRQLAAIRARVGLDSSEMRIVELDPKEE